MMKRFLCVLLIFMLGASALAGEITVSVGLGDGGGMEAAPEAVRENLKKDAETVRQRLLELTALPAAGRHSSMLTLKALGLATTGKMNVTTDEVRGACDEWLQAGLARLLGAEHVTAAQGENGLEVHASTAFPALLEGLNYSNVYAALWSLLPLPDEIVVAAPALPRADISIWVKKNSGTIDMTSETDKIHIDYSLNVSGSGMTRLNALINVNGKLYEFLFVTTSVSVYAQMFGEDGELWSFLVKGLGKNMVLQVRQKGESVLDLALENDTLTLNADLAALMALRQALEETLMKNGCGMKETLR